MFQIDIVVENLAISPYQEGGVPLYLYPHAFVSFKNIFLFYKEMLTLK